MAKKKIEANRIKVNNCIISGSSEYAIVVSKTKPELPFAIELKRIQLDRVRKRTLLVFNKEIDICEATLVKNYDFDLMGEELYIKLPCGRYSLNNLYKAKFFLQTFGYPITFGKAKFYTNENHYFYPLCIHYSFEGFNIHVLILIAPLIDRPDVYEKFKQGADAEKLRKDAFIDKDNFEYLIKRYKENGK